MRDLYDFQQSVWARVMQEGESQKFRSDAMTKGPVWGTSGGTFLMSAASSTRLLLPVRNNPQFFFLHNESLPLLRGKDSS